jgi:hypothetical protein
MSANSNTEAVSNQGEFRSRVPPSESLTTKGVSFAQSLRSTALSQQAQHAPGVKVGNDTTPNSTPKSSPLALHPQTALLSPTHKMKSQDKPTTPTSRKKPGRQLKTLSAGPLPPTSTRATAILAVDRRARNSMVAGRRGRVFLVLELIRVIL